MWSSAKPSTQKIKMENEVRNRRTDFVQDRVKNGMSRFESVMSESVYKFRLMPSRAKIVIAISGIFSLLFYIYVIRWLWGTDAEQIIETLINTETCPACCGATACGLFYNGMITFSGFSKFRTLDMINARNIHYANVKYHNRQVVVKKLGTDSEIKAIDLRICREANRPEGCDVARVMAISNFAYPYYKKDLTPSALKQTGSFMFYCPSFRLLERMWSYFQEYKKKNEIFMSDKMQVLYMNLINPEPLVLQTFPKAEGWPFPEYLGSCGRMIVVENAGRPLSEFFYESFQKRVDLAYQLMNIADTLTTKSDFILYLTDVTYENFAVDADGKVTVIDLENIIVVDKIAVETRKKPGWDVPYEALFSDCDGQNCLVFNADELCIHTQSDHNYNAVCRNLLSHYANEDGCPGGLLHDIPPEVEDQWGLANLLEKCARPKGKGERWIVKEKIMEALSALRHDNNNHLKSIKSSGKRLKAKLGRESDQS